MKLTFITIIFSMLTIISSAKVLTLSNDVHQPAMFTKLTDAYDVAQAGDTIYIYGSATSYGNITLKKKLTLIGSGFRNPNENQLKTTLNYIYFDYITDNYGEVTSISSGSTISGIDFAQFSMGGTDLIFVSNLLIKNCIIGSGLITNNSLTFINCIIEGLQANNSSVGYHPSPSSSLVFKNNMILNRFWRLKSDNYSIVFVNNTFINSNANAFSEISGAIVSNNIFYVSSAIDIKNSYLNNNLYILKDELNGFNKDKNNHGSNNLINTDPQFVRMPKFAFDYTYNYRLKDTSPGKNAGTDGTDIGVTGGLYPWPVLEDGMMDYRGRPSLPYIDSVKILNPVIPSNGTLNILLKAKSQN